jgi:hypothetical protein
MDTEAVAASLMHAEAAIITSPANLVVTDAFAPSFDQALPLHPTEVVARYTLLQLSGCPLVGRQDWCPCRANLRPYYFAFFYLASFAGIFSVVYSPGP